MSLGILSLVATCATALKNAIDICEKVKVRAKQKNDPEALKMASDFLSALMDIQGDFVNLQNESIGLAEKLRVAENHLEHRAKLIRRDAYYEFAEPVQGYGKGPFCLNCTDVTQTPIGVPVTDIGHFSCSKCGSQGWLEGKHAEAIARNHARNEEIERRNKDKYD